MGLFCMAGSGAVDVLSMSLLRVHEGTATLLPVQVSSSLGVGIGMEYFRGMRASLPLVASMLGGGGA